MPGAVGVASGRVVPADRVGWPLESLAVGSLDAVMAGAPPASALPVGDGAEAPTGPGTDGVSVASSTPCTPPARNGSPTRIAKAATRRTTTPMPAGTRRSRRRWTACGASEVTGSTVFGWVVTSAAPIAAASGSTAAADVTSSGVTAAAPTAAIHAVPTPGATGDAGTSAAAYLAPHSGHPAAASSQHQRQAKMSHAGQWHRPTHGPIAAVSTDVPQRSQKGSGAPPGSRAPCLAGLRALPRIAGTLSSRPAGLHGPDAAAPADRPPDSSTADRG